MTALSDWDQLSERYYHHDCLGVLERAYSVTDSRFGWYYYPLVERGAVRVAVGLYDSAELAAEAAAKHGRSLQAERRRRAA